MKQHAFILLLFITTVTVSRAQISWGRYSHSFTGSDTSTEPVLITAIPQENNAFWPVYPGSILENALAANPRFMQDRPSHFTAITTFDNQQAHFFVKGLHRENANDYEYRVLEDGTRMVAGWLPVVQPASDSVRVASTLPDLYYIGGYKTGYGHNLIVDLRQKRSGRIISTAVVSWQPIRPQLVNIYTVDELNEFLKKLSHPQGYKLTPAERKKWQDLYGNEHLDAVTGLPLRLQVEAQNNSIIFVLKADIQKKEQVEYELVKNNDVLKPWGPGEFDNHFIWLQDLAPGNYLLKVRYSAQPANVMEYSFEVKSPPGPGTAYILQTSSLIAAFLAFILFMVLYLRQKLKTKKEASRREKLSLEMKRLRSQLNPHFIFNALNSIQGLVNTGQTREANEYLALFAGMMRETLALSEMDQAPLQKEIGYLDAYLRLEQLRFNFTYSISVDPLVNKAGAIPTLLLQPLVENGIRHGIAGKAGGRIEVTFDRMDEDLVISVRDNGKGFAPDVVKKGYGLYLTHERIRLINDAAGEQQITMQVKSNQLDRTEIQLIFKAWTYGA